MVLVIVIIKGLKKKTRENIFFGGDEILIFGNDFFVFCGDELSIGGCEIHRYYYLKVQISSKVH